MRNFYIFITAFFLMIGLVVVPITADWEPSDGHKMHGPQMPDETGWDVNATDPVVLADDWLCTETGWVKDIHFWGSWLSGVEDIIPVFFMVIYSNIPADQSPTGYSIPGEPLWTAAITDYDMVPIRSSFPEGWYDPFYQDYLFEDHMEYFQYNIFLDSAKWFYQEEGTIYWLSISALVENTMRRWGWKSSLTQWNDNAVMHGDAVWFELYHPPSFADPLDLAFVITGGPLECGVILDSSRCFVVDCPVPTDQCLPQCVNYDPATGDTKVLVCECVDPAGCYADMTMGPSDACIVTDNGSGTADLPPVGCEYVDPYKDWMIIAGLPPGTTIEMDGILMDFVNITSGAGGSLGGEYQQFEATLDLTVRGTGDLLGFNRHLAIPVTCETHSAPRTPGDPVQTFTVDFYKLQGELFGDPDFCTFRITGGTFYGMPSPGQTSLTELPGGSFAVESFFDVTYQIEFEGCPASPLEDYMGITTDNILIRTGAQPMCLGDCPPGEDCEPTITYNPDGTQDICCSCVPTVCEPLPDSSTCRAGTCENPSEECQPQCVRFDLTTGNTIVTDCACETPADCHVEIPSDPIDVCVVEDNGYGTADLPPVGCDYLDPVGDWMIIDGFPPGTTIEMDGILMDFINITSGLGGSLGGEYQQFEATLDLTVTGTGSLAGFNRHLAVPITCETHSANRNPGDPVQTFAVDFYDLSGELFGDPDFCTLRIRGGTNRNMPSPGETTLRVLPSGDYAVESFFDITYQIEFEGCPASPLEDYMGTTTATIRIQISPDYPSCAGQCPVGEICNPLITYNEDGTVSICCECEPDICAPTEDGTACRIQTCTVPGEECLPSCVKVDPLTGETIVSECECRGIDSCQVEVPTGPVDMCVVPDNGSGTANLPPVGCDYVDPEEDWMIIDGLPPGTTIEMDGILMDFISITRGSGGSLGGEYQQFEATLDLTVTGTGDLAGFNRHLAVPLTCETHSAPRTLGAPIQTFATDFYDLDGELFGDPDFCTFRITGGTVNGLPSPGQTTLTGLGGDDFAVESFFDVTYQIEFEGCPASPLEDYSGTTTATIRIQIDNELPACIGECPDGEICYQTITSNIDGTFNVCCDCVPKICEPLADSSACRPGTCDIEGEECQPTCARIDLATGETIVTTCECKETNACHVEMPSDPIEVCTVEDNGYGTADLPPVGCDYVDPVGDWMIIDGFPPGTTIEMDGILMDFINITSGLGGSLGGEYQQFEATLDLTVRGTGSLAGFNRHLAVPITCETHSANRNPGDPVQTFAVDFYDLSGELFGDPDFCTLRIRGGTNRNMPSPGETTLRVLPSGDYAVESFFDVTYQIEFEGCPDSPLADYSGTTTATIRILISIEYPSCAGDCPLGEVCNPTLTYNLDGTVDVCCACELDICEPNLDSTACKVGMCTLPDEECQPSCVKVNPLTGETVVSECECRGIDSCQVEVPTGPVDMCVVPNNGSGTADLPPVGCDYIDPEEDWMIIDGLPPGTTIEMDGILMDFFSITRGSGGSLGGEYQQFEATLDLTVTGTGDLAGFNRHIAVPITCETHSAPRTLGAPVQIFATVFYELDGELFGDPDFCTFRVTGGTVNSLPSPGQTTLTDLGGDYFAVESFFDITYQIEFEGCPASPLEDYSGATTATIRIQIDNELPNCIGACPDGEICYQTITSNIDGTFNVCCDCIPKICEPLPDSSACRPGTCEFEGDECQPTCARVDLVTGETIVKSCECIEADDCHIEMPAGPIEVCTVPDNGTGTANLPPVGCEYLDPDKDWMITDGLPPGTTIEMEGKLMDFINITSGSGGLLGGEYEQFEATLDLTVSGTGSLAGFNRHLAIPLTCETHSAPRIPGNPVQTFAVDFYRLDGELFGDPDFCELIVRAGTFYEMASPGETTLRELPNGDFAVESFFDVTYQIEFEGCPASQISDYSGTTTDTIRIQISTEYPACAGGCLLGEVCAPTLIYNQDGTVDVCCECVLDVCEPVPDSTGCKIGTCPPPGEECQPTCLKLDLETGETKVSECECHGLDSCVIEIPSGPIEVCLVPDNGTGTADLPPIGCEYIDPVEDWTIIDGLPPGTTVEMDGKLMDFINIVRGSGGLLGGEYQQFEATLDLTVSGTGELDGFNRHLAVPISGETHSAPRTLGTPVQTFMTDFYDLQGELFGDPDFCELRITGGTKNALPSPGQTTLYRLSNGDFVVESFFDVTHQIEFEGCPDGQLADYSGTTTATIRIQIDNEMPACIPGCPEGYICQQKVMVNLDGTLNICCECMTYDEYCDCMVGDANGDGSINIGDEVYIENIVFRPGSPPPKPYPVCSGDANSDCTINIGDAVFIGNIVFRPGSPLPPPCVDWILDPPAGCGMPLRK